MSAPWGPGPQAESPILQHALKAAAKGWPVFRLKPNSKKPLPGSRGFKDATTDPAKIREWWAETPTANYGIATGEASDLTVVDADVKNGVDGIAAAESMGVGEGYAVNTPSGGIHFYCQYKTGDRSKTDLLPGVDIRATGGYVVGPGSKIGDNEYTIRFNGDAVAQPDELRKYLTASQSPEAGGEPNPDTQAFDLSADELRELRIKLAHIDAAPYEKWLTVGMGLYEHAGGSKQLFHEWNHWSQTAPDKYDGSTMWKRWQGFASERPDKVTFDSVDYLAREGGYAPPPCDLVFVPEQPVLDAIEQPPADIFSRELPPINDILQDVIPPASGLFVAPGDDGKTTQLAYLACAVCTGREIFDRIPRRGKVGVAMGEDATEDFWRTLTLIGRNDPALRNREAEIRDGIIVLNQSSFKGSPRLVRKRNGNFEPGEWFAHFDALLANDPDIRLLILDTMSSLGLPENDGINDAPPIYHAAANALCQKYDVAILATGHVGQTKAENRDIGMYSIRSGTSLADNARFVIQMQRHYQDADGLNYPPPIPPADLEGAYVTRWHVLKKKFSRLKGQCLWTISRGYRFETYGEQEPEDIRRAQAYILEARKDDRHDGDNQDTLDVIATIISKGADPTRDTIEAYSNLSRRRVGDALTRLLNAGQLRTETIENGKRGANPTGYFLTN